MKMKWNYVRKRYCGILLQYVILFSRKSMGIVFIYELPYSAGTLTETRDDINSNGAFSQASC